MTSGIKKDQHYVWQYYLRQWLDENQIWCFDKQKKIIYKTPTASTSQRKLFYKIEELNPLELSYTKAIIAKNPSKQMREEIEKLLGFSQEIFGIKNELVFHNIWNETHEKDFRRFVCNFEENYHVNIENTFVPYLEKCYNLDIQFTENYDTRWEFASCIWVQLLRTAKIRDLIQNDYKNIHEKIIHKHGEQYRDFDFLKIYQYTKYSFAYWLSYNFASDKTRDRLCLLHNLSDNDFITSDQPAFNINAVLSPTGFQGKELDIFYPISPKIAISISPDIEGKKHCVVNIKDPNEITNYNNFVAEQAHRFVYAKSKNTLSPYLK